MAWESNGSAIISQSSTNSAIVIWCITAAVYERKHTERRAYS